MEDLNELIIELTDAFTRHFVRSGMSEADAWEKATVDVDFGCEAWFETHQGEWISIEHALAIAEKHFETLFCLASEHHGIVWTPRDKWSAAVWSDLNGKHTYYGSDSKLKAICAAMKALEECE